MNTAIYSSETTTSPLTTTPELKTPFLSTDDFTYSVQCRPLLRPSGSVNLRITRQWAGARDPKAEQVALDLTLNRDALLTLATA